MEALSHATAIVHKLKHAGYIAYFAGGWVRDYVMNHPSSDIDIATNAPPEVILDLFPRTILVGMSFGVVIVLSNGHQYEVSTFRKDINYQGGRKPEKIELSTPEEDALRRDFTINGMFFDPEDEKIYDYVGGMEDIERGIIRTIGSPYERFVEDRLRMVRAFRFASRFNFEIDPDTQQAITENADTLFPAVAMERIWQEFTKMTSYPRFEHACLEMQRLGLLQVIFPSLKSIHFNDFKHRVHPFPFYPAKTPAVLYLLDLFPDHTTPQLIDVCRYLKMSGAEIKLLEYAAEVRDAIAKGDEDPVRWAHLYAHPASAVCLETYAARLSDGEKTVFLEQHKQRILHLHAHIARIRDKRPLITSSHLLALGIPPGKLMGTLLDQAEKITISQNFENPEDTIKQLQSSTQWPRP